MLRPVRPRFVAVLLVAASLSGCGAGPSDTEQVQAAVEAFGRASAAKDYQGLPLPKADAAVSDGEVDAQLQNMRESASRLEPIEGQVPTLQEMPPGCAFAPRCPWRHDACDEAPPPMYAVAAGHESRCVLVREAQQLGAGPASELARE